MKERYFGAPSMIHPRDGASVDALKLEMRILHEHNEFVRGRCSLTKRQIAEAADEAINREKVRTLGAALTLVARAFAVNYGTQGSQGCRRGLNQKCFDLPTRCFCFACENVRNIVCLHRCVRPHVDVRFKHFQIGNGSLQSQRWPDASDVRDRSS